MEMWSGLNSGRPRGGAVSMGYAGLVIWVGGLWSELGFQCEDAHLSPSISSFHCKESKTNRVFCLYLIFLLQGYVSTFHWRASKA
jgi:hypothetical protein